MTRIAALIELRRLAIRGDEKAKAILPPVIWRVLPHILEAAQKYSWLGESVVEDSGDYCNRAADAVDDTEWLRAEVASPLDLTDTADAAAPDVATA